MLHKDLAWLFYLNFCKVYFADCGIITIFATVMQLPMLKQITMRKLFIAIMLAGSFLCANAQHVSVAGLFPLENSGRVVYNFNQGWRFLLGDAKGAEAVGFL